MANSIFFYIGDGSVYILMGATRHIPGLDAAEACRFEVCGRESQGRRTRDGEWGATQHFRDGKDKLVELCGVDDDADNHGSMAVSVDRGLMQEEGWVRTVAVLV